MPPGIKHNGFALFTLLVPKFFFFGARPERLGVELIRSR
jgi:hypothetical protein